MATQPTDNFDFQNFYSGTLQGDITASSLTLTLDTVPTPTEGILVIEPDSSNREIIFYTGKTTSTVTLPSDGRGWDGTTATQHLQGSQVIMAPTAYMLRMLKKGSLYDTTTTGWTTMGITPTYSTNNGQREIVVTTATDQTGKVGPGTKIKFSRTSTVPTQVTSLNGTNQYWSKTSPTGMTFTDDFASGAWIYLTSYPANRAPVVARYNGTSGFILDVNGAGIVRLIGYNGGSGNISYVQSYQSVPLNKWVHITAQLDMSAFTATSTTSYVMIDGVDVPAAVVRAGTNPTAIVQAGDLTVGFGDSTQYFPGKIQNAFVYSAKVTQQTIRDRMYTNFAGNETNLVAAYTFNGTANDVTANANNLTPSGGAGYVSDNVFNATEYGIITKATSSQLTIFCPQGAGIPNETLGTFSYSTARSPYGFPASRNRWSILSLYRAQTQTVLNTTTGQLTGALIQLSTGSWKLKMQGFIQVVTVNLGYTSATVGLSTSTSSFSGDLENSRVGTPVISGANSEVDGSIRTEVDYENGSLVPVYLVAKTAINATVYYGQTVVANTFIEAECAYL